MWNNQPASAGQPAPQFSPQSSASPAYDDPSADPEAPNWSPEQMTRLEGEWRKLQRSFAYHPHVTVQPLKGDPPYEYQIDYRLTTLVIDPAGQLQYAQGASVHVWLPPEFPEHPPLVRPLLALFHPNVSWEGFHLESAWQASDTLVTLVRRIGDLLTYRIFDPNMVVNDAAMDWLHANAAGLPLDGQANFAPTAGGEPLGKIVRFGAQTIDGIRQSLHSMQAQLLSPQAPDAAAVRDYSLRTRLALDLFLEGDVPDNLRSAASALHDCARELPSTTPSYDFLRARRAALAALRSAIKAALQAKDTLSAEMQRLGAAAELPEGMDPDGIHDPQLVADPNAGLRLIPLPAALQPFQLRLPKQVADADKKVSAVKTTLNVIDQQRAPNAVPSDTMLGQKLEQEFAAVEADTQKGRGETDEALSAAEPVVKRAKEDAAALDQVARYREYVDLLSRGRELERRLAEWGTAGVQGYYIRNGAANGIAGEGGPTDRFGPFQFEQPVELGEVTVLARNAARGAMEVFNAAIEKSMGQSTEGKVTVTLGGGAEKSGGAPPAAPQGGEWGEEAQSAEPQSYPMTFELTDRCDDLLVQLDFLRRQTQESVDNIDPAANASPLWCGVLCRQLSSETARGKLRKEAAKISQRWRFTMLDLAAMGPFKERVATYHLLARAYEKVPPLVRTIKECRKTMKESDKRLAEIMRHCNRDVETERLIVPPKYDKPYQAELTLRKETGEREVSSATLLKALVLRLGKRLQTSKLLGRAGTPSLRVMKPLPAEVESLPMSDADLGEWIFVLEDLLHASIGGPRRDPSRAAAGEGMVEGAEEAEAAGGYAAGAYAGAGVAESADAGQEQVVEGFSTGDAAGVESAEGYAQGYEGYAEGGEAAGGTEGPYTQGMDGSARAEGAEVQAAGEQAGGEATRAGSHEGRAEGQAEVQAEGGDDFVIFDEPESGQEAE